MTVPTTRRATNAFIGSPIERLEDLRFLTGRGQYTDDLTDEKMLHAVILRSSVAHGRIRSVDAYRARLLALPEAILVASQARQEELCRILVERVVVRDREVETIDWTPPARPFFEKQRECPQGDSNP